MLRATPPLLLSAAVALLVAAPAGAATLYGAVGSVDIVGQTEDPGSLLILDPSDASVVQSLGDATPTPGVGLVGLAANAAGQLYATTKVSGSPSDLLWLDPDPLAPSLLLSNVGTITWMGSPISINDLSFQPGTGVLYGTATGAGGEPCPSCLFTIDTTTAIATLVGDPSLSNAAWNKSGGLAFAPDGTLYGTTSFLNPTLVTLDPVTGAVLTTEAVVVAPPANTEFGGFFDGLAVSPDDGLLYATHGVASSEIFVRNATTHQWELIGASGEALSDLAFLEVPEPAAGVLLLLGALAFPRRRVA